MSHGFEGWCKARDVDVGTPRSAGFGQLRGPLAPNWRQRQPVKDGSLLSGAMPTDQFVAILQARLDEVAGG